MTTCCALTSDDGDGPSIIRTSRPVARKEHRCCECAGAIAPGQRYERTAGCWDGNWDEYVTCLLCVEIRDHFACGERGGWVYTQVWEQLEESLFPDMTAGGPCFTGLSPAARDRLFERRMAWLFKRGYGAITTRERIARAARAAAAARAKETVF